MQSYLMSLDLTVAEKKMLFLLRSRMYPVKNNFQNGHNDLQCSLCQKALESQEHLLVCEGIVNEKELKNAIINRKISYEDIFGSQNKQREAIRIWMLIDKIWRRKLKNIKTQSGSQEAPLSAS